MNKHIFIFLAALAFVMVITSCNKEDDFAVPVISDVEIGYENGKIAYRGSELHVEANIVAEGRIDRILVEIHPEGDHDHKSGKQISHDDEWEFEYTWTEFNGLKNTNFHEHIDIPVSAEPGDYHFHFEVIDMQGNVTEFEAELEVRNPENTTAPLITITSAPADGEEFHTGETISISGTVTHELALGGMYIGLVRASQNLEDEEVNATNTITLLHTHTFESPSNHAFTASITVGTAQDNNITPKPIEGDIAWHDGDYYILVKAKDAFGGPFGYSQHYHIDVHLD
jgi:hypothetical protein